MTTFDGVLERLGLMAYSTRFRDEGFDTWETLMDITENDLDTLDVKLGHRRKLQRAISQARGIDIIDPDPGRRSRPGQLGTSSAQDGTHSNTAGTSGVSNFSSSGPSKPEKRKYIRHPPSDPNAPKRPSPAYVIFSNELRSTMKPKLEFGEFTKLVGQRWQALDHVEKETREAAAQRLKDKYNKELIEYKKTPQYAEHLKVLADWKLKNEAGQINKDWKRHRTAISMSGSARVANVDNSEDDDHNNSGDEYGQDDNDSPSSPGYAHSTYSTEAAAVAPGAVSRWRAALHPPVYGTGPPIRPELQHTSGVQPPAQSSEETMGTRSSGSGSQGHASYGMERSSAAILHHQRSGTYDQRRARGNSPGCAPLHMGQTRSSSIPPLTRDDTLQTVSTSSDRTSADNWSSSSLFPDRSTGKGRPSERTLPSLANLVSGQMKEADSLWQTNSRSFQSPSSLQPGHYQSPHSASGASSTTNRTNNASTSGPLPPLPPLYGMPDGYGPSLSRAASPPHRPPIGQADSDADHAEHQQIPTRDKASLATLLQASKQVDGNGRSQPSSPGQNK